MGWNVYDEAPRAAASSHYIGEDEKEVLAEIFFQHAVSGALPVTPWYSAAASLSKEFPALQCLSNHAILGRVFQMIDRDHDGILDQDEFVNGIYELLHPTTAEGVTLAARIAKGNLADVSNDFSHVKRVAILGAGVAGLQTARHLGDQGISCTLFEKDEEVGGVWRKNYADFGLQVPKELFEFPDFPYPETFKCDDFPTGEEVQEYILLYCEKFNLREKIRFKTFVTEVRPVGSGKRGWEVHFKDSGGPSSTNGAGSKTEIFDFLVVATGMYGWPPHMPVARGSQKFQGEILHSCTFTDRKQASGKKVIVIGGGKSAIDNVVSAAKESSEPPTLVCRNWHWPVPRLLLNLVPFKYGTYSRFGHWMLHPYYGEGSVAQWFHGTCAPVKWIWWRVVELMFRGQFHIKSEMMPPDGIDTDLFSGGQILNYEFRDMLSQGKIRCICGAVDKFTEKGVVLTDGTELSTDLVIYGTGFAKNYDLFDKVIQEKLSIQKDGLYLYRNIIPPHVPDVAFIGSEVSTFNNILTQGIQALWLSKLMTGKVTLPSIRQMDKTIEKERAWKRSWMPAMSSRANIWQLHMMKYHDNLIGDMNEAKFRKMPNCFGEILMPYSAADYRSLFLSQK